MPYIKTQDRIRFQTELQSLRKKLKEKISVGELNYLITMLCIYYIESKKESYQTYNDLAGVLNNADKELYRRRIATYENVKIKENGEVF